MATQGEHEDLSATRELVRRARAGELGALDALVGRYRPRLMRWASGRVPARLRGLLATEDLVQEALAKTFVDIGRLRRSGALPGYLRTVVLNGLRDAIRRHRTVALDAAAEGEEPTDPGPSPAETLLGRELLERYEAALARLSESERAAIIARMEWRLGWAELAAELDFPSADAARMAVSRALAKLSREIRDAQRSA